MAGAETGVMCFAYGKGTPKPSNIRCSTAAAKLLQSFLTLRPHRQQPTRLSHPWDSPGKNTGVGCHFLLQCMKVKSESEVAQSCPTLRDPMDCSLPGSSVHGFSRQEYWSGVPYLLQLVARKFQKMPYSTPMGSYSCNSVTPV